MGEQTTTQLRIHASMWQLVKAAPPRCAATARRAACARCTHGAAAPAVAPGAQATPSLYWDAHAWRQAPPAVGAAGAAATRASTSRETLDRCAAPGRAQHAPHPPRAAAAEPASLLLHEAHQARPDLGRLLTLLDQAYARHGAALSPEVYVRLLRQVQRLRLWHVLDAVHAKLVATEQPANPATAPAWLAVMRAHAARGDWASVEATLQTARDRHIPLGHAPYQLAVQRMHQLAAEDGADAASLQAHIARLLAEMRADGAGLNDELLAQMIRALAAPVRAARAQHASAEQLAQAAAPAQRVLHGFFHALHWDSTDATPQEPSSVYRTALAAMLEVQLDLTEAIHLGQVFAARVAHRPYRIHAAPTQHTARVRELLHCAGHALDAPTAQYLHVRLVALEGHVRAAVTLLDRWVRSEEEPAHRRAQRAAFVTLFSRICTLRRDRRLPLMLDLLTLAGGDAAPALWGAPAGTRLPPHRDVLLRLWRRALRAWAARFNARRSARRRERSACGEHGWPLLERAIYVLRCTAARVDSTARSRRAPRCWAALLSDAEVCRSAVWAAVCAAPNSAAPARLETLGAALREARVPGRVWRWAHDAARDAAAYQAEQGRSVPAAALQQALHPTPGS